MLQLTVALLDADICESAAEVNKAYQYINPCKKSIIIGRLPAPRRKGGIGIVKGLSGICFKAMTSRKVDSLLSGQGLCLWILSGILSCLPDSA